MIETEQAPLDSGRLPFSSQCERQRPGAWQNEGERPAVRAERDGLEHGKKTRAAIKAGHLAAVAPLKAQAPSR
jgi:hypothetical protein